MKADLKNKEARLEYFRALYDNAREQYADTLERLRRNMEQYRGSDRIDGSPERACTVRNITYEIVESQIGSDIPLPKVDCTCYSERRDRAAKSIERLCASLRDRLPFEEMNDLDERYTYIYGGSVWYVEWDSNGGAGEEAGGVTVRCLSPLQFTPQPGMSCVEDMEYLFLRFPTTRGELERRYGVAAEALTAAGCEPEDNTLTQPGVDGEDELVSVIVAFYRDGDGDVCRYVFSGDLELSHLPKYYRRKREMNTRPGTNSQKRAEPLWQDEDFETLRENVPLSDGGYIPALSPAVLPGGVLDGERMVPTRLPYYVPRSFPVVIRKNTSAEGMLFGQSDCEYIRPQQQAINKIESRILQKLLRAGITPIVPEDASITLNNSVFGQLIKMKPGESAAQYGKVDTTPDISQDIAEAERLYEHAKRIIGISDAYQGIDRGNESGVARQLRISQASGRLESKKKMKYTAYAALDRRIFEYYLAFADEPRSLSYKDAFGRTHGAQFNRYDFLYYDPREGCYRFDDAYLFSVDLNGGTEYQRESLWERNLANLQAGTLGDPADPVTLLRYWQCQERAHYPFARENVEYFMQTVQQNRSDTGQRDGGVYGFPALAEKQTPGPGDSL